MAHALAIPQGLPHVLEDGERPESLLGRAQCQDLRPGWPNGAVLSSEGCYRVPPSFCRRGRDGLDWRELNSMKRMISSSAVASAVDERCNLARSNPPWIAERKVMLRIFGFSGCSR